MSGARTQYTSGGVGPGVLCTDDRQTAPGSDRRDRDPRSHIKTHSCADRTAETPVIWGAGSGFKSVYPESSTLRTVLSTLYTGGSAA